MNEVHIVVTSREGEARTISGRVGESLMEAIRSSGFGDMAALCGGCCSCATCHVHVDGKWLDRLPRTSDDEEDLLDTSVDRDETSRLSCQIRLSADLEGLAVTVANED